MAIKKALRAKLIAGVVIVITIITLTVLFVCLIGKLILDFLPCHEKFSYVLSAENMISYIFESNLSGDGNRCSSIDPFRSNNWSSSDNSEYNFAANLVLFAKDYYQTKIATIVVLTLLSLIVFAIIGFVVYLFILQRKRQIEVSNPRYIVLKLENQLKGY